MVITSMYDEALTAIGRGSASKCGCAGTGEFSDVLHPRNWVQRNEAEVSFLVPNDLIRA